MQQSLTFQLTEDEFAEFLRHLHANSPVLRRQRLKIFGLICAILVVISAFAVLQYHVNWVEVVIQDLIFLAFLTYLARWRHAQRASRHHLKTLRKSGLLERILAPTTMTIEDDGIRFKTQFEENAIAWKAATRVEQIAHSVLVWTSELSAYVIPHRAFDGTTASEAFMGFVQTKIAD